MSQDEDYSSSPGYRRGLVLGFTVAEIILLVLFALLLALVGSLINNKGQVERANIIVNKFDKALASLEASDKQAFVDNVNKVISQEIDYEKKLREIQAKLGNQPLPDDVYATLVSNDIDVKTKDGKEKLLDLLLTALAAEKRASTAMGKSEFIEAACKSGMELQSLIGNESKTEFFENYKNAKAQTNYWKSQADKCGLGGVLPPCYRENTSDPIPFIYEARINNDGIKLVETVPDKYKEKFYSDFKSLPKTNETLTPGELISSTRTFLDYGAKNECRFYVTVFDEMQNDKDKFKSYLKSVESNFYKRQTW